MSEISPGLPVYLTKAGALKDGEPDREWFEESCRRSQRAIEFAREEMERELLNMLREGYGDRIDY